MIIAPIDPNLNIVRDGLVLWLDAKFQTSYTGSGTTWSDLSGNGLNGTLTNGPTFDSDNGGSIVFDGTNDYVDCGDNNLFTMSSGFTLELWAKLDNASITMDFITKNPVTAGSNSEFVFGFFNGNLYGWISRNGNTSNYLGRYVNNTSTYVGTINYTHFIMTYDGGTTTASIKIYINTTQRDNTNFTSGAGTGSIVNGTSPVTIGMARWGLGGYIDGKIGSVRIYNRALSSTEITHNYDIQKIRFGL